MSQAIVLNKELNQEGTVALPQSFDDINPHNLHLYVKSYLASLRAGTAHTKTRSDVSGGGKKPWSQKGGGRARAGSITSPVFVGGGVAFGPRNNRNFFQKINKKQKRLALACALSQKAQKGKLFVVDSIKIESGKTKDAASILAKLGQRDTLIVANMVDEKTYLAFRNIPKCYVCDAGELNAYLIATYTSVVIENDVFQTIVKEG